MRSLIYLTCLCLATTALSAQTSSIPHIERKGNTIELIVDGKPFLARGGELHNSSTSSADYMRPIWKNMADKNLNTVIAAVYWEMVEPKEGRFDFTLVDSMLTGARKNNLHLVLLWFATWKNGYSTYTPGWVKHNYEKYPHARDSSGNPVEMLSTFGEATAAADAKAFKALMAHIKATDAAYQTVIAAQIENEMGLIGAPRDCIDAANKAFAANVPSALINYLAAHKGSLQPELDSVWKANGYKTTGNWQAVFGKSIFDDKNWKALSYLTEELFTVYHYAKYVGQVAAAGKEAYPIPMYLNAWIKQDGFAWPGRYPAGGPTPHTLDVWRAAAPAIDFISPDIYITDAQYTITQYHRPGNPVFIPEIRPGQQSANEAFWAYGQQEALCFSPFGIDETEAKNDPITKTYAAIKQLQELILQQHGKGTMAGIYLDTAKPKQEFDLGNYQIKAQLEGMAYQFAGFGVGGPQAPNAGGILINIAPDEFIAVGKDLNITFIPLNADGKLLDVEYCDEGKFVNGQWVTTRRLNGDEGTGGGDWGFGFGNPHVASLRLSTQPNGDYTIVRFKIYGYK